MNMFTDKGSFRYCAVDEDGDVWLYSNEPYTRMGESVFRSSDLSDGRRNRMINITRVIPEKLRTEINDWLELNDWRDSVVSFTEPVGAYNAIDIISGHFKPQKLEKYNSLDSVDELKVSEHTLDLSELSIEQLENLAERVNSRIKEISTVVIQVNLQFDMKDYGYLIVDGDKLYRCKYANFDTDKNYWRAEGGSYVTSLPIEFIEKIGKTTLNRVQSSLIWNIRNLKGSFDLVKEIQLKVDEFNANNTAV